MIRSESRDESEKEHRFEQRFMRVARQQPEFQIDRIWRWPERMALTGLNGRDLVARRISGEWVTIQFKRYENRTASPVSLDPNAPRPATPSSPTPQAPARPSPSRSVEETRAKGGRCILYDKMGSYSETFVDPKRNVLLGTLADVPAQETG